MRKLFTLTLIFLLAACATDTGPTAGTPFLGGTQGVVISFEQDAPPPVVYDSGTYPFDVVIKADNRGEFPIPQGNMFIQLEGFESRQFGRTPQDLIRGPQDPLTARYKDSSGATQESTPSYVEFPSLNFVDVIPGAELSFPLRARACYLYGTIATTKLCARDNVLNPRGEGICNVNEDKEVFNSGAPVQISSVVESARGINKIGFTFKISHVGQGEIYQKGHLCDESTREFEDRVFVEVTSPVQGLACTGLSGGVDAASGFTQLFGGSKTITCTQNLPEPGDFEFPVTITLTYDYEDSITTNVLVKHTIG